MNGPDTGHIRDQLQGFTTLSLGLQCVKWVRGSHPRTEERGRHMTAFMPAALTAVVEAATSGHAIGKPGCPWSPPQAHPACPSSSPPPHPPPPDFYSQPVTSPWAWQVLKASIPPGEAKTLHGSWHLP